ncbi:MAG: hypothetical protein V4510_02070 [bacterium]
MIVPEFLLRRLYKRGSLRETGDGRFAFTLQNPLRVATILAPPHVVVNGISYKPSDIGMDHLDLSSIAESKPFVFRKGQEATLHFPGRLMRGGNRIHITVETKEFGHVEIYVEDKEAEFCELPTKTDAATTA